MQQDGALAFLRDFIGIYRVNDVLHEIGHYN
jgi:hypothetical protein